VGGDHLPDDFVRDLAIVRDLLAKHHSIVNKGGVSREEIRNADEEFLKQCWDNNLVGVIPVDRHVCLVIFNTLISY
jgi:hypothetical protein